jgi:protein tyrosine/serine phosphatase
VDLQGLTFSTVFNFRDLGDHLGAGGQTVHFGRLYRSDSLHRMTGADGEVFAALGMRTVLDLRRPHEIDRDGRVPELPGLVYFNIHPVHQEWDPALYDPAVGPHRYLADRYLDMAEEGIEGIGSALRLIAEPDRAPLVMHCFAGKDRTGVLAALTLSLLGVDDEDIAAEYSRSEAAQVRISAQIRQELPLTADTVAPIQFMVCPPQTMKIFLTELAERYGSVRGYTAAAGVTDRDVAALRAHLLAPQ